MFESVVETLVEQLKQLFGESVPKQAVYNIKAMALAEILKTKGFAFQLKDMCPKKITETNWRATFLKEDAVFAAKNTQSAVAVCMAAVDALGPLSE